jgi:hypothetical protein
MPAGNTILASCGSFHVLAKNAYERTASAESDRTPYQHDALTAIILSVVSLEAFIGELEVAARFFAPHSPEACRNRGRGLADALELIEEGRGQLALKFQIAKFILTGTPYVTGAKPYQDFDLLLDVRNRLIHPKPFSVSPDESGSAIDPLKKFLDSLRSLGIIAESPREKVVAPVCTWVQTRAAARWACNTAAEMAHSLFAASGEDSLVGTLKTVFGNGFIKIN